MQKYNPEVKPIMNMQSVDPKVADLVEKLRKVHHVSSPPFLLRYSLQTNVNLLARSQRKIEKQS